MAKNSLLAEWFWTDRWTASTGFMLPLHARGLYREMLTQAWARGARLPNNFELIQRCCGITAKEWKHSWPLVQPHWRVDGLFLVNDTQLEIYAEALVRQTNATRRGQAGAQARRKQLLEQNASRAQAQASVTVSVTDHENKERTHMPTARTTSGALAGQLPRDHLRHRVCGRVCLHEQQFEQFVRKVGGDGGLAADMVREWATAILAEWDRPPKLNHPIQGNNFAWWDARYEEWQGSAKPAPRMPGWQPSGAHQCPHTPSCKNTRMCYRVRELEEAVADGRLTQPDVDSLVAKLREA